MTIKSIKPLTEIRLCAILTVLKSDNNRITDLIATGQTDLIYLFKDNELTQFLTMPCFQPLQTIAFDKCGLKTTLKIDHFESLKEMDLSNNEIQDFPNDFTHSCLAILKLHGNPIRIVTIDPKNVPKLTWLSVGSVETRFICGPLLERCAENGLVIYVDMLHKKYLLVPLLNYKRPSSDVLSALPVQSPTEACMAFGLPEPSTPPKLPTSKGLHHHQVIQHQTVHSQGQDQAVPEIIQGQLPKVI